MSQIVNSRDKSATVGGLRIFGFTLMEVMISLIVLAIGVMGVIGLQVSTYKELQTSHNFSRAAMLASEMADRMLANQQQVLAGAYIHDAPTSKPSPDCASADCTAAELAAYDVWSWQAQLLAEDPDDPTKKIPGSLPKASGEVLVDDGEYFVLVRWDDDPIESIGDTCGALDPDNPPDPNDRDCYALNLGCLGACP